MAMAASCRLEPRGLCHDNRAIEELGASQVLAAGQASKGKQTDVGCASNTCGRVLKQEYESKRKREEIEERSREASEGLARRT